MCCLGLTARWSPGCWPGGTSRATDGREICYVGGVRGERGFLGILLAVLLFLPIIALLYIVPGGVSYDEAKRVVLLAWRIQVMANQVVLFYFISNILHLKQSSTGLSVMNTTTHSMYDDSIDHKSDFLAANERRFLV